MLPKKGSCPQEQIHSSPWTSSSRSGPLPAWLPSASPPAEALSLQCTVGFNCTLQGWPLVLQVPPTPSHLILLPLALPPLLQAGLDTAGQQRKRETAKVLPPPGRPGRASYTYFPQLLPPSLPLLQRKAHCICTALHCICDSCKYNTHCFSGHINSDCCMCVWYLQSMYSYCNLLKCLLHIMIKHRISKVDGIIDVKTYEDIVTLKLDEAGDITGPELAPNSFPPSKAYHSKRRVQKRGKLSTFCG